jgi:hypothetical protein
METSHMIDLPKRCVGIRGANDALTFWSARMWNDAMTGLASRSLGAAEHQRLLSSIGLSLIKNGTHESVPMTTA